MADTDTQTEDTTPTGDSTDQQGTEQETTAPTPAVKDDGQPVTASDWSALNEALRKARKDAREAKRTKPTEEPAETPDVDKAVAEAKASAAAEWKPKLVRSAARSAFLEAGLVLPKTNADGVMARVLKMLDLDDLDVADDGTVDGLAEQVAEIRGDFPELFATTRKLSRVDGADKPGQTNGKPKTSADMIAGLLNAR